MTGGSSGGGAALHAPTLALIFALLLITFTVHDLDRRADADGYFRVAGRPVAPAGRPGPRWPAPPPIPRGACSSPPPW